MSDSDQISLYELLVDQLTKYNAIFWQVPTALVAVNILAVEKLLDNRIALLGIILFNAAMIFAFCRMVVQQRSIIDATRGAEDELRQKLPKFIPRFTQSKIRAPMIVLVMMIILEFLLLVYASFANFGVDWVCNLLSSICAP